MWKRAVIAATCIATFIADTGYSLLHYLTYHAPAFDLAFFDNVAEHPWTTTFLHYSFLGQHWEPLLLTGAVLDRLAPTPIWLILIQGLALASAPLGAALLARAWQPGSAWVPVAAALGTMLNPLLSRAAAADFHMEALTPALTLFALAAAARRHTGWLLFCCTLLLCTKEDAALVVVAIGLIVWRVERRPRMGAGLMAAGVTVFLVLVLVVMPSFRNGHTGDLAERYAYLGGSAPGAILAGALGHPDRWVGHVLSRPALDGLSIAFVPLALLPLLGGAGLIACAPPLAISLLSADDAQASLQYHYGLEAAPLLIAAALLGWRRLPGLVPPRLRPSVRHAAGAALAGAAVVAHVVVSPLPGGAHFKVAEVSGLDRRAAVEAVLHRVPAGEAVSASTGLVAHLSARSAGVFEFNGGIGVRWVVIDAVAYPSDQSRAAGYYQTLSELRARGYVPVAGGGGVTLWRKT